ncbi:hypothetical protein BDP27DRAFT_1530156 [Rhodocollybia butyracea]|uniref:G-protein coupled receptors family 2 profile 2 domain-containing protein n=1 Tax=Rhodocollybia butyracea TaxID=206335 RepID=A0A9P5PRP5_9AGAR|nr:hypothetical protein BDP27DRAFT_1530156 [Rhodocollybia butyracea]
MAPRIPNLLARGDITEAQLNFAFRLLVYTLIFNVLYGIAFSVTAAQTGPGPLCDFGAFAVNLTLFSATFFYNLYRSQSPFDGKRMEKYYIIGTILLTLTLTVPTYALNQFGFDKESNTCWFKNPDYHDRLQWLIGTQSFWIALAAAIETICSCVVLYWMFRQFQNISQYFPSQASPSISVSMARSTCQCAAWDNLNLSLSTKTTIRQAYKYRSVILRIALDLNSTILGTSDELTACFRFFLVYEALKVAVFSDLCLYGFRTAVYAMLAAYDPGFLNAVREIRASREWSARNTGLANLISCFASASRNAQRTSPENLTRIIEFKTATHSNESKVYDHSTDDQNFKLSAGPLKSNNLNVSRDVPLWQPQVDEERIYFTQSELQLEDDREFGRQL